MAKAGKGVRTRQYNPRKKRRNPGATNLAQYVQAAVDHTRKAHDAGGKIIHETPKAKRREFAREIAWRKGYRSNPEQVESEKLSHAAVGFESPSRHRGQACASCVHLIAASPLRCEGVKSPIKKTDWCNRFELVQIGESPADKLYRKFHGRKPDAIYETMRKGIDPYGEHPELTALGPLVRLVVGEDLEISDEGEVEDSEWDNELVFVPSMAEYYRECKKVDTKDRKDVREFRAWLKSCGVPDVAGVPPNGEQLYFPSGQKQLSDDDLRKLGCNPNQDILDLGECWLIEYFAMKRFDRFEATNYFHQFGEKSGVRPRLIYMRVPRLLLLAGGDYVVKSAGIDN